jgi:hypothetical protein
MCGRGVFLSVRSDKGRCRGNIFLSIKIIIHHLLLGKGGVFLSVSSFSGKLMPARYLYIKLLPARASTVTLDLGLRRTHDQSNPEPA